MGIENRYQTVIFIPFDVHSRPRKPLERGRGEEEEKKSIQSTHQLALAHPVREVALDRTHLARTFKETTNVHLTDRFPNACDGAAPTSLGGKGIAN